jgi:hypothetical protein
MTMSHDALTMYIFQPILLMPIGMMNTNTSLCNGQSGNIQVHEKKKRTRTYAKALSAKLEKARPLARIE